MVTADAEFAPAESRSAGQHDAIQLRSFGIETKAGYGPGRHWTTQIAKRMRNTLK